MGVVLAALEMVLVRDGVSYSTRLGPMLLMSNLIGLMIHAGSVLSNRLLNGWPRRARGLPRVLFSMALMGVSVLLALAGEPDLERRRSLAAADQSQRAGGVAGDRRRRGAAAVHGAQCRRPPVCAGDGGSAAKGSVASSARMLAEARLRALQAQIEPHFLYNTLANVVSLIGPQPAQAQHMLERFIDYLRASLAASRSEDATLASEAGLIAAYLDVLAVRMGERLRYRIEVPDELRQFRIAPMLLQPVVENAIAHGLEPKVEGGEIVVSARVEGDQVCVRISDTGVGLNESAPRKPGGGVGLSNLRERLRSLYGAPLR
jgi:signal transduction histidine kinase